MQLYAAKTREERLAGKKVIVILRGACLELVARRDKSLDLLNGIDHRKLLKRANRKSEDCRPDIIHQCLLALLDSPLNKAGKLLIYIQTADRQLIEISPHLLLPRTWHQFVSLMVTFLRRKKIKAVEKNVVLMRLIKNDLEKLLPPGSRRIGLSPRGKPVRLRSFVEPLRSSTSPVVFVVGAVAHSDPLADCAEVEEKISISPMELSAACCCGKICAEFEDMWDAF